MVATLLPTIDPRVLNVSLAFVTAIGTSRELIGVILVTIEIRSAVEAL